MSGPKRVACPYQAAAIVCRSKIVLRRPERILASVRPGDQLLLVERTSGVRQADQVVLALVEVVDVRVEPIGAILNERDGMRAEGWAGAPADFPLWWGRLHKVPGAYWPRPDWADRTHCRRIEYRYLDPPEGS